MTLGKAIQIYLPDGNPHNIKVCDINTSFVKGILIPRNKINEIPADEDLSVAGVYFLIKDVEEVSTFSVYIGEAENLFNRLKQHDRGSDWDKALVFLSSKGNMNKAHYRFLEKHCYNIAKEIDRFKITNANNPSGASLSPADRDLALHFFEDLKTVTGTLGFPLFEEIILKEEEEIFYLKFKDAKATGSFSDEGFIVYANSTANVEEQPSATGLSLHRLRQKLVEEGVLLEEGMTYRFTKNHLFGSPSTAGAVVRGGNTNGWVVWKDKEERTIDELKRK
jgi:hypothetical protein